MASEFEAELRLLTESEGGRAGPIRSGYRGLVRFGSSTAEPPWGVQIDFVADSLQPGGAAAVRISTWADPSPVSPGTQIWLFEGGQLVGEGTIK